jgi:hypothetical protein
MIQTVQRTMGKGYPSNPEELVEFVQRVLGPLVAELRERMNQLPYLIGTQIEETETELAAIDTFEMTDGVLGIAGDTRVLYSLEKAGTPGIGDLTALPTGRWKFVMAL